MLHAERGITRGRMTGVRGPDSRTRRTAIVTVLLLCLCIDVRGIRESIVGEHVPAHVDGTPLPQVWA
jgi:hypothetical protein